MVAMLVSMLVQLYNRKLAPYFGKRCVFVDTICAAAAANQQSSRAVQWSRG